MFIEPLLLLPSTDFISNWYHPEISELTHGIEKKIVKSKNSNLEYYGGSFIGFRVKFPNDLTVCLVVLTNDDGMKSILKLKEETHFVRKLTYILSSNDWKPGGKFFKDSEYGIIFNKVYPMSTHHFELDIFNNINLVNNGSDWWFI